MGFQPHTKFQRNPSSRFRDTEKGHICTLAYAHMQIYPTHDLCNMHRCLVSKQTPNLVTIDQAVPELYLAVNFDTIHVARATCQGDPAK